MVTPTINSTLSFAVHRARLKAMGTERVSSADTGFARSFRAPWFSFVLFGAMMLGTLPLARAVDSPALIEATAIASFKQDQAEQALAYLEAQLSAATPAEKDLVVGQQLTRIAFTFQNQKDRAHAEFVANLACIRTEARLADFSLTTLHFSVFREQAVACESILGDVGRGLARVDGALRYIDQNGSPSVLAQVRAELLQRRQRLLRQLKIQQRPH